MKTFEEIKQTLIDSDCVPSKTGGLDYFNEEQQEIWDSLGHVETVHSEGDCEGGGEHSEKVLYFAEHEIYIRITGFYSSYDGTDWYDEMSQVYPKKKTITVYE